MSLFPAYTKTTDADKNVNTEPATSTGNIKADWLKNTSFVYTDDTKLQHLNYAYLSSRQKDDDDLSTKQKSITQKRHYIDEDYTPDDNDDDNNIGTDEFHSQTAPKKHKTEQRESGSNSDSNEHRHHHVKKKKKKHKKPKHHHDKDKNLISLIQKEATNVTSHLIKQEGKIFLDDFGQIPLDCNYYIDRSSDKNNYTYQSIYKGHLPKYKCMRNASLGVSLTDLQTSHTKKSKKPGSERYYESKLVKAEEENDDIPFIEPVLQGEDNIKQTKQAPVLESYMALPPSPRHGNEDKESVNLKDSSTISHEMTLSKNAAFKKQEEYNQRLTDNPNNVSLWLEFINFQDQCSLTTDMIGLYEIEKGMKRHKKHEVLTLQMKEAIFERALKENPYSTELKMAQLECFKNYWDTETLQTEWKDLVMRNKSNPRVWQKYLNYIESKAASFRVSELIKAYKKCIVSIKSRVTDFLLDIFCQLCYRLRQSGHLEKATALFQAQLEYNLFAPSDNLGIPKSELTEYFQAFWESGAPRIGEENAKGWNQWMEKQGNVQPFVPFVPDDEDESLEQEILKKHNDKYAVWHAMEMLRTSRHWLAWRPDEKTSYDDCEDLERLVVSDDLIFALFKLNTPLQKFKLLCYFLDFLGVPAEKNYYNICRIGIDDQDTHVKLETMSMIFRQHGYVVHELRLPPEQAVYYINRDKFVKNIFDQMLPMFRSSDVMCSRMILMYIDFLEQNILLGQRKLSPKQLKPKAKEMRSAMKKLLYEEPFRQSILAWLRYALIEWCVGRVEDARKALYHILTSLVSTDSRPADGNRCLHSTEYLLYRTYAEMELGIIPHSCLLEGQDNKYPGGDGGRQKALDLLVSVCNGDFTMPSESFAITTLQLVKCKKHYEDIQDKLIQVLQGTDVLNEEDLYMVRTLGSGLEHWIVCYQIFIYLTSGLPAASDLFQKMSLALSQMQQQLEKKINDKYKMISEMKQRLTESHVALLKLHVQQECVPLRIVRQPLLEAIQNYPTNPDLLWSYILLELKSAYTVNLRRHLAKICSKTKSSLVWTLSLVAQLQRLDKLKTAPVENNINIPEAEVVIPEAGYVHTVRNWFQWVLSTDVCSHYLLIWRLYLSFEIQYGKPDNAKRVFYEAVQHCPWAKCLYLDYIQAFPDSTQEIVDLMTEREIRVHVPLEEVDILLEDT